MLHLLLVFLICLLPARDAWAYLDPGTGSFMLQAVIALVLGGLLALKQYWARLKAYFSSRRSDPDEADRK